MIRHYILDDTKRVRPEPDLLLFLQWMTDHGADCQVGLDQFPEVHCGVSTVFLGIDHRIFDGPPLIWESMVFGGPLDLRQRRCSGTWEQAEAMHHEMVAEVQAALAAGTAPAE